MILRPREVQEQVNNARQDHHRLKTIQMVLDKIPVKLSQQEFYFLSMYFRPQGKDEPNHEIYAFWKRRVEEKLQYIEDYLKKAQQYLDHVKLRGFRSTIPKKQQRKLGLLPPV